MPKCLWKAMEAGRNIIVKRSVPLRCDAMVKEYFLNPKIAQEIKEISKGLRRVISKENKEKMIQLIEDKEYEKASEILLVKYYDPLYEHTLNRMEFVFTVNTDDLNGAEKVLKDYFAKDKSI